MLLVPFRRADDELSVVSRRSWGLLVAGVLAEGVLIGIESRGHWGQFVVALAWSLVTWLGILLWLRLIFSRRSDTSSRGLQFLAILPIITLLFSWSCRLGGGGFADLETLRFGLSNARMVGLYILQTEPLRAGGYLLAALALTLIWLRAATRWVTWVRLKSVVPISLLAVFAALAAIAALAVGGMAKFMASGQVDVWDGQPLASFVGRRLEPREHLSQCLLEEDLRRRPSLLPAKAPQGLRSVVWIAVESLRSDVLQRDHQGRPVMPNLRRLSDQGVVFSHVWAASTHSDYSDVSALSSTYPLRARRHVYYQRDDPWPRLLIWDALSRYGYETALVSAQNEGWGGMEHFIRTEGLSYFWDSRSAQAAGEETRAPSGDEAFSRAVSSHLRAGKVDDAVVVDEALEWLKVQSLRPQPYFLALNFQSSHFPYELGAAADRPFSPWELDFEPSFTWYPPEATEVVRNGYFNALSYIDEQLGRLLGGLDALGIADQTLVVVYGENGESFHENGQVTHAGAPFEPALRVPVVLWDPSGGGGDVVEYPMSLVDLAPTLLGRLDLEALDGWQGVDVLASDTPPEDRVLYFHNENPISRVDGAVVGGRWKLWYDRETARSFFYDLLNDASENQESQNSELRDQLEAVVSNFRCRQLRYYEHPLWPSFYLPPDLPSR